VSEIFQGVDFYFIGEVDYCGIDPDEIAEVVRRLTEIAKRFNLWVVSDFGGRSGPEREPGLVAQAVGAAFQSFGGLDPHPETFEKAAMLLRGITQGHPFDDGNKRTGLLTAAYFLWKCGYDHPADLATDAIVEFCWAVSAGTIRDVAVMAEKLREFWQV
jgi:death-on-curing protein